MFSQSKVDFFPADASSQIHATIGIIVRFVYSRASGRRASARSDLFLALVSLYHKFAVSDSKMTIGGTHVVLSFRLNKTIIRYSAATFLIIVTLLFLSFQKNAFLRHFTFRLPKVCSSSESRTCDTIDQLTENNRTTLLLHNTKNERLIQPSTRHFACFRVHCNCSINGEPSAISPCHELLLHRPQTLNAL
jgi:hypothetical protein